MTFGTPTTVSTTQDGFLDAIDPGRLRLTIALLHPRKTGASADGRAAGVGGGPALARARAAATTAAPHSSAGGCGSPLTARGGPFLAPSFYPVAGSAELLRGAGRLSG